MSKKPIPGSYIDTQGMGGPMSPEEAAKWEAEGNKKVFKPMIKLPQRLFTPTYVKEMKILINEVLDEREYQNKLKGGYDDPKPPEQSYWDMTGREYEVR